MNKRTRTSKLDDPEFANLYRNYHRYIRTYYGKADHCENIKCSGKSKHYEWALKSSAKDYSKDPNDYIQLCKSCHLIYDRYVSSSWRVKIKEEKRIRIKFFKYELVKLKSPEEIFLNRSKGQKGKKKSESHRKAMSEAAKKRWHKSI